jgi:hypothetical protein
MDEATHARHGLGENGSPHVKGKRRQVSSEEGRWVLAAGERGQAARRFSAAAAAGRAALSSRKLADALVSGERHEPLAQTQIEGGRLRGFHEMNVE